jgi:diguanylate cyclase (GGDEF)-like protein
MLAPTTALLIVLFALLSFWLCMAALSLRQSYGLAPLTLVIGLLEGLKYHVSFALQLQIDGLGSVSIGSLVSYLNLLAVIQVVHMRMGLATTRQLAWGVVALSVASGLLHPVLAELMEQPGIVMALTVDHRLLLTGVWVQGVGNLLLLLGLVVSVVLVDELRQRGLPLWLALSLSLVAVSAADSVLFLGLAFGAGALSWEALAANIVGKSCMALLFAGMATLALRDLRDDAAPGRAAEPWRQLRGLLSVFSFRQRIEAMELELQTDPLTGLFNRRYLERVVPDILRIERERGQPSCLVLLDLDHFKAVNDQHGHLVGDAVLQRTAQVLRQHLRRQDSVLRYGGEEFLLLLPATSRAEAVVVVEQVLTHLRAADAHTPAITATAGLACAPDDGISVAQLLQRADERLYEGKRTGRDRLVA